MAAAPLAVVSLALLVACRAPEPPASAAVTPGSTASPATAVVLPATRIAAHGYSEGVVATSEEEPALAAARILEGGGNAIDAAAAAQFMLNVVEPESSGIGGGGFMMIYLAASGRTVVVDSREAAPAAATPDLFLDSAGRVVPFDVASTSGSAVGVPGTLRGLELALARWGTRSLAETMQPAIEAAENGITVDDRLARTSEDPRLQNECGGAPGSSAYDVARRVFRPGGDPATCGSPVTEGSLLVQPELARTLRLIAGFGPEAFYDCDHPAGIARAIVATQQATRAANDPGGRGRMTCEDLAHYHAVVREPVVGRYRNYMVMAASPPSSGGITLIEMLKMLERFPLGDEAKGYGFGRVATLNVMQEAMRLAFADRAVWLGDTDAVAGLPVAALLDDTYIRKRSASCPDGDPANGRYCITPGVRMTGIRAGDPRPYQTVQSRAEHPAKPSWGGASGTVSSLGARADMLGHVARAGIHQQEGTNTTHFAIADRWGNIVSYTTSIEAIWGSGLMVPGFGFLLNNELTDFNATPQRRGLPRDADWDPGANDVAPFKRPRSSMTPTIVFERYDGGERPVAAYGSPGGSTIINTVLNIAIDLIDHRMTAADAVARPRLSLTSAADSAKTTVEAGFDPAMLATLGGLGYRIGEAPAGGIGAVQAVVIDPATGLLSGEADPRRNGTVIGLPPATQMPVAQTTAMPTPALPSTPR